MTNKLINNIDTNTIRQTIDSIEYKLKGYDEIIDYLQGIEEITDDEDINGWGINEVLMNVSNLKNEEVKRLNNIKDLDFSTNQELDFYCQGIEDMKNHLLSIIEDLKDNGDYQDEQSQGIFFICKNLANKSANDLKNDLITDKK